MKMHRNPYWLMFLGLLSTCVLGYTLYTCTFFYEYFILSSQAPAKEIKWVMVEGGSDHYQLKANYFFEAKGTNWPGSSIVLEERLINPWAAQQAAKRNQNRKWTAWYNPNRPHHSTLQKYFPTKECISTVVLWALWCYFIWLGIYVTKDGRDYT